MSSLSTRHLSLALLSISCASADVYFYLRAYVKSTRDDEYRAAAVPRKEKEIGYPNKIKRA
jgi:hypothetical protein